MKTQESEQRKPAGRTPPGWYARQVPLHPETALELVCSYEGGRYGRTRMEAYDGERLVHCAFYDYARWEGHAGGQLLMADFVTAAEKSLAASHSGIRGATMNTAQAEARKIEIVGRPEFYLPLTEEEVDLCFRASQSHYDDVCRAASDPDTVNAGRLVPGGFLARWRSAIATAKDSGGPLPRFDATWRELDTLSKILEHSFSLGRDYKKAGELMNWISDAFGAANQLRGSSKGESEALRRNCT